MANNESSKLKVDNLSNNNCRRSSRIANITTSQDSSKPSTSSNICQKEPPQSKTRQHLKRKRTNSVSSIDSSASKNSASSSKRNSKDSSIVKHQSETTVKPRKQADLKIKSTETVKSKKNSAKSTSKPKDKSKSLNAKGKNPVSSKKRNNSSGKSSSSSRMDQSNNDDSSRPKASSSATNASDSNNDAGTNLGDLSVNLGFLEDERDIGRLHALLENRGIPAQLFSALNSFGPRVHQLIQRQMGSGIMMQVNQLQVGLVSTDESQQMTAAVEMAQILVMGNEESLASFPIKPVVASLINIMKNENNFALVNHACRALTYMMEALPRSSSVIVEAAPIFLDKLKSIQCIDVAEQSLSALAKLSKRHANTLLKAGAVSTSLQYIDFFSIPSQRTALTISLNCCRTANLSNVDLIVESSQLLIQRLNQVDQKSLEIVCQTFITLVENLKSSPKFIEHLINKQIIEKLLSLMVVTPQITSPQTFVQLLHMLVTMCTVYPDSAVIMLTNNIADTLYTLLVNNCSENGVFELAQRSPLETYEIVSLIGEIMPILPQDGIFSIDQDANEEELDSSSILSPLQRFHWMQDVKCNGTFTDYSISDSTDIEMAYQMGDIEVLLENGESKILFRTMTQVYPSSNKIIPVRRDLRSQIPTKSTKEVTPAFKNDARISMLIQHEELFAKFIRKLFIVLYQVYNSSAGPSVHQKCLQAILRMINNASAELLTSVLSCNVVASCIASMLTSSHIGAVVNGLQITTILMQKMPQQFNSFFRRQGVLHQIENLTSQNYYKPIVISLDNDSPSTSNINETSNNSVATASTSASTSASSSASNSASTSSNQKPSNQSDNDVAMTDCARKKSRSSSGKSVVKKRKNSVSKTLSEYARMNTSLNIAGGSSSSSNLGSSLQNVVRSYTNLNNQASLHMLGDNSAITSNTTNTASVGLAATSNTSNAGTSGSNATSSTATNSQSIKDAPSSAHQARSTNYTTFQDANNRFVMPQGSQPILSNNGDTDATTSNSAFLNMLRLNGASQNTDPRLFPHLGQGHIPTLTNYPMLTPENLSITDQQSSLITGQQFLMNSAQNRTLRNRKKSSDSKTSTESTNATPTTSKASTSNSSQKRRSKGLLNSFFGGNRWKNTLQGNSGECSLNSSAKSSSSMIHCDEMRSHKKSALTAHKTTLSYAKSRNSVQNWIGNQAKELISTYFPGGTFNDILNAKSITSKIRKYPEIIDNMNQNKREDMRTILLLTHDIVINGDATSFELIQSGMVNVLLQFFNHNQAKYGEVKVSSNKPEYVPKEERLQIFSDFFCRKEANGDYAITTMIKRLIDCLHYYEQLPVKVLDLPEGGTNSMKFINNNQLKCLLSKHESCNQLKAWRGGPVNIDPLAVMSSLERYLILRGYTTDTDEFYSDDETEDDEDMDEHFNVHGSIPCNHRIEFLIGDMVLPYSMTIYEAIRLYSPALARNHTGQCLSTAQIWGHTHILHYRFKSIEKTTSETSVVLVKSKTKVAPSSYDLTSSPSSTLASDPYLHIASIKPLEKCVTFKDRCLPILNLLKILHNLITYGHDFMEDSMIIENLCSPYFESSKIDVKVLRHVNDPLVVLTADLPNWIPEISKHCPFLIPFTTREIIFASTCFDRIRLLVRLQEMQRDSNNSNTANSSSSHNTNTTRMLPRLERKKRIVDRTKILSQAEILFKDMAGDKSLLEIQYVNEVGTGLGPTLEFYSLVSKELQRSDLDIWRGEAISENKINSETGESTKTDYMFNDNGLFFKPVPILTKKSVISTKKKNILIMIGQFMAKSLIDSRMIDIHLSIPFYKSMLAQENIMTIDDLEMISPDVATTFRKLNVLVQQRNAIQKQLNLTKGAKHATIDALLFDGCSISDLSFDFTLPGFPSIELIKGGHNINVTIYNVDEYMKLVLQTALVTGVKQQFVYVKKGFNQVFNLDKLKIFYPKEMDQLHCGNNFKPWTVEELMRCTKCDHGFNVDSATIRYLFNLLASYNMEEQREFLRFITGSPRLPIGGLSSLNPLLTIVKKHVDEACSPNDCLPSVMTCVNYLKLPAYTNESILFTQLKKASQMGQGSFHLS